MQSIKKHTLEGIDFSRIALFHGMSPKKLKVPLTHSTAISANTKKEASYSAPERRLTA